MQVGSLIQRVESLYYSGVSTDDRRLMRRQIYSKLLSVRSTIVFNKLNKNQFISRWNYDYINCLALEEVPENQCPCVVPVGCTLLRSVEKLPKPLQGLSKHSIESVYSVDNKVQFSEVTYKSKNWRKYDKYTSKRADYFILDDYLYITNTRKLKAVNVVGLFHDPIEVGAMLDGCSEEVICPVNPMDLDFRIDEDLVDTLIELTVKEIFIMKGMTTDRNNNSKDETQTEKNNQARKRDQ